MRILYLFFTAFFFLNPILIAQKNTKFEYKFETLSIKDGLSQGMINAIIQDQYGFMWFATNDGLNRFDGYNFSIFKNNVEDSNSIAGNFIRFLFEDSKGRIWIGTANNGLDLFDRETETFIHFKHNANNINSISSNSITSISEDKFGHIWVGTFKGLNMLSIKESLNPTTDNRNNVDIKFTKIIFDKTNPALEVFSRIDEFPLADWRSSNFYPDENGIVWVSAQGKLFQIVVHQNENYEIKNIEIENYKYPSDKTDFLSRYVQSFIPIPEAHKFYMLFSNGVTEVSTQNNSIQFLNPKDSKRYIYTYPICRDKENNLYVGINNQLEVFNPKKNGWNKISSYDRNMTQYLDFISCSYLDKSGNIWIGTQGYGILKYNNSFKNFNTTENVSINYMSPGNSNEPLFIKNPMDEIFYAHDVKNGLSYTPINKNNFKLQKGGHHDNAKTKSIIQDKDGSYWIGRIGLYHYEPKTKKTSYYWDKYDDVFPLYDDDNGHLLFGNTHGLVVFDKKNKTSVEYPFPIKSDEGPYDFLQAIYKDDAGIIWLGTLKGLFSFDVQKVKWTHFKNIPRQINSLSYDIIFSICPDPIQPNKFIWIGTKGGGLNKFEKSTGTFERFGIKEGLPNDVIYGIISDVDNNLWMSTNFGLSKLNVKSKSFFNYNEKDGLQGNEFNRNAFCKTADNTIFFGGLNGFNYFNPRNIVSNTVYSNIIISSIKINYNLQDFKNKGKSLITKPSYLTKEILLNYTQNNIAIEFSSLDFSTLKNNKYEYKLEGYDLNWIQSGIDNKATYTNLNPGEYTFLVRRKNNNGNVDEKIAQLSIKIYAPWFNTWWFKIVAIVFLISLIYFIYRYRINQFKKIQKIKNDISKDLHDDVGANLSSISIFAEVASDPNKTKEEIQKITNKILSFTNNSQESMSDIIWMIDSKNDTFLKLISRIQLIYTEFIDQNNTQVMFKYDTEIEKLKLTTIQIKSIYLIFKEAVNNINKYAQADKVEITILKMKKYIELKIVDNGVGFDIDKITSNDQLSGNGLKNIKLRTKEINGDLKILSSKNEGTKIILTFPY